MKQRTVVKFLVAEGETPVNIYKRLQTVYIDKTLDYSNTIQKAINGMAPYDVSQNQKKLKTQKSVGKIITTVFWDAQEVILVDFLPKGKTINFEAY